MRVLAVDTSTFVNTVALCEDERLIAETVVACGRRHSERLLATITWVLEEAGFALEEVDALAVSVGPGSFTGLRVGVATLKGLAAGAGLPLVPVPTLDAMTRVSVFTDGVVCPVLDAKMGEVFTAVYRFKDGARVQLRESRVEPIGALLDALIGVSGRLCFLGDGSARYRDDIRQRMPEALFAPANCSIPRASAVAVEAAALLSQGVCADPAAVEPAYLRRSQAEEARAVREKAPSA